jgi:hypothetical protein
VFGDRRRSVNRSSRVASGASGGLFEIVDADFTEFRSLQMTFADLDPCFYSVGVTAFVGSSPSLRACQCRCPARRADVTTILGRPPRSFEQFATDYAGAFSPTLVAR